MTDRTADSRVAALAILGLSEPATAHQVTRAYRRLAKTFHPDVAGPCDHDAARRFAVLAEAYHALTSSPATPSKAVPQPPRNPVPVTVRFTRPPIIAGPVRIMPSPGTTSRRKP
jgi:DnaJ-like protein